MFKRAGCFLKAIWARITAQPDLPKFRPIESLDGHLRSRKQEATQRFGPVSPIGRLAFESLLGAVDTPCTIEAIVRPSGRDIEAIQHRIDPRGLGSVLWPVYKQREIGWTQEELQAANGHEVLRTIHDVVACAKTKHRAEWCGKEWSRHSGLAEVSSNGRWYHMQMIIGQRNNLGGNCLITFHFFVSVDIT